MTIDELRAILQQDEISYDALLAEGRETMLPLAEALLASEDPKVASAAAYVFAALASDGAGLMPGPAEDPRVLVRLAVAGGLSRNPTQVAAMVAHLLDDEDVGVRRLALRASKRLLNDPGIRARVARMASDKGMPDTTRAEAGKLLSDAP